MAVTAAACCAALFAIAWRFLAFTGFNNDHYVHVSRGYQILLGELPVRDFVDPGMPLMYIVSAVMRAAFGPALGTEWALVAGAFAIAAAATAVAAARLSGSIGMALLVVVFEVALNPRSFGYPKIMLYAVAAPLMIAAAKSPTTRRIVALAGLTAIAFLFRHDHGLFVGIGSLATVVLASSGEGRHVVFRRAALLALWVAALLAPWAIFVQSYVGVLEYFQSAIAFSRGEAALTTLRAIPRFRLSEVDSKGNALSWLFYLFHALPFLCLSVVWWHRGRNAERWRGEHAAVAALALMAVPLNVAFIRETLEGRIADAIVPAALLGAWMLGQAMTGRRPRLRLAGIACAAVLVVVTAGAVVRAADVREQLGRTGVLTRPSAVVERAEDLWARLHKRLPERDHVPSRYSRAMLPFIEYVYRCTPPDDRLLMTALFPEVYVMADRGFAGGQMAFMSGFYTSDADQTQILARLERQSVPFVVIVNQYQSDFRAQMPRIVAHVEDHYALMAEIPVPETQGVQVYVDSRKAVRRLDAATGWPCFQ